jgi:Glycosyltransferase
MPPLLRSADLVISTCQYEPSGTTSLQAMACGTPVIAPPVGGHMDAVVDGTTGIIIPRTGRPCWRSGSGSCSRTRC